MTHSANARLAGVTGMVLFGQATSAEGTAAKLAGFARRPDRTC